MISVPILKVMLFLFLHESNFSGHVLELLQGSLCNSKVYAKQMFCVELRKVALVRKHATSGTGDPNNPCVFMLSEYEGCLSLK